MKNIHDTPLEDGGTENFKVYLYEHRLRDSTVNGHLQNVGYFLKWVEANGLHEPENISYNDLLNYVQYEQQRNKDVSTINLRISSISKYFEYLKSEDSKNPLSGGRGLETQQEHSE